MKIAAKIESDRLVVDVEVTNELDEPLYLKHWNLDWYGLLGIPEMDANKNPQTAFWTRELAYVCMGSASEVVLFNGKGPGPPPGIDVFAPRWPQSTRLPPKQTFHGTLRLPLPLREWHAHAAPRSTHVKPAAATQLRYRLETLCESHCRELPVKEAPSAPGLYRANGHPVQILEASVPLPAPITVLQRTDHFERFA